MQKVKAKERLLREHLQHDRIVEIRGHGLMLALILEDSEKVNYLIHQSLKNGLILFWLLYEPRAARITPPLNISDANLVKGCQIILQILDQIK
jgi:acetylornithine aminotransferase